MNHKRFAASLFRVILRGSEFELPAIAGELARSARSLVHHAAPTPLRSTEAGALKSASVVGYAHDTLLLMGDRKLCRHIVASAPGTAIAFFQEAAEARKHHLPLGQFGSNVTSEALLNKDSLLFHERQGFQSGLVGYLQPFSKAMYGNFMLLEGLSQEWTSPLDLDYRLARKLDTEQFAAYAEAALLTFKDFVNQGSYLAHSRVIRGVFEEVQGMGRDVYLVNGLELAYDSDQIGRLEVAVDFAKEAIDYLGTIDNIRLGPLRLSEKDRYGMGTVFDDIADLIFELIFEASSVRGPPDTTWWVQHNVVWSDLFSRRGSPAWNTIRFKVTRLLYDEIKRLETMPNFKSASILGFCLNVLGLTLLQRKGNPWDTEALSKAVLSWTKKNYLKLRQVHPPVADHCLLGSISFDAQTGRLVKTYAQGLNLEPSHTYLDLLPFEAK